MFVCRTKFTNKDQCFSFANVYSFNSLETAEAKARDFIEHEARCFKNLEDYLRLKYYSNPYTYLYKGRFSYSDNSISVTAYVHEVTNPKRYFDNLK